MKHSALWIRVRSRKKDGTGILSAATACLKTATGTLPLESWIICPLLELLQLIQVNRPLIANLFTGKIYY
jgi:hypothetical protein